MHREIFQTNKIFTPTSPAIESFVERNKKINNHLVDALMTPGKQVVLYGHSGCGKTTFLKNKLNQTYETAITTRCMEGMTFDAIILNAFDQLGKYYTEITKTAGYKIAPSVVLSYNDIKATINLGEISSVKQSASKYILPPQLTPQRLATFFGEFKACWILEDFHKVKGAEKTKVSQLMKIFMDMSSEYPDLKLIALGAVNSARQVIEYDKEMNNRVAEVYMPYMSNLEIQSIIDAGEKLLNLKFSKEVKLKIVKYSCGLPSICHQLCLNICFNKSIYTTSVDTIFVTENDLDEAIEKYVDEKSDTLKAEYDKAVKVHSHSKQNIPKEIIKAALRVNKDEFLSGEILLYIKDENVTEEILDKYLEELCSVQRSEIFVLDENSNRYHFNNLFLKGYCLLSLKGEKENPTPSRKEARIVDRLLEIIEKDMADDVDYDDAFFEDHFG